MNIQIEAGFVKSEISRLLLAYPELSDDEILLADALEGETGLFPFVEKMLSYAREAETTAAAIKARESALAVRRGRFEQQSEVARSIIRAVMMATGVNKILLVEATLSLGKGRESIEILSLEDLPQGYFTIERKADKEAIKAGLDAGQTIPGAKFTTGKTSLIIRTK
jgi:Siphovirus Gp157